MLHTDSTGADGNTDCRGCGELGIFAVVQHVGLEETGLEFGTCSLQERSKSYYLIRLFVGSVLIPTCRTTVRHVGMRAALTRWPSS